MISLTIPIAAQVGANPPSPVALTLRNGYAQACRQFEIAVRHLGGLAVHSLRESVGPAEEAGIRKISWSLASVSSSVPRARHLVRAQLTDWEADEPSEIAELLVSELVTNTLHHAWGPVRLSLSLQDGTLRCEVQDASSDLPHMRNPLKDDEGGRGLHLLDLLSQRWGSDLTPTGKVIWFELPAPIRPDPSQQFGEVESEAAVQGTEDGPIYGSLLPLESPENPSS
jgi:anti-sigma regulatory factor (Ser/Thr protein kinase)